MPGIVGLVTKLPRQEALHQLQCMIKSLLHEAFYTSGFYSDESLVELQTKAADEVVRVLTGEAPRNPVNPEALQRA